MRTDIVELSIRAAWLGTTSKVPPVTKACLQPQTNQCIVCASTYAEVACVQERLLVQNTFGWNMTCSVTYGFFLLCNSCTQCFNKPTFFLGKVALRLHDDEALFSRCVHCLSQLASLTGVVMATTEDARQRYLQRYMQHLVEYLSRCAA